MLRPKNDANWTVERVAEKVAERVAEKVAEKAAEKVAEKSSGRKSGREEWQKSGRAVAPDSPKLLVTVNSLATK